MIPAAATKESVKVDLPAGNQIHTIHDLKHIHVQPAGFCAGAPTVVNMSNNTHVTDVLGKVHEHTDLLNSELDHGALYAWAQAISLIVKRVQTTLKPPPKPRFSSTIASQPVCA